MFEIFGDLFFHHVFLNALAYEIDDLILLVGTDDQVDIFKDFRRGFDLGKTADRTDVGIGIVPSGGMDEFSGLCFGGIGHAARKNEIDVRFGLEICLFEVFIHVFADIGRFVIIDFAA